MNALMGLEQQELVTLSIFFGRFRKLQVIGCDALTSNCCQDNDLLEEANEYSKRNGAGLSIFAPAPSLRPLLMALAWPVANMSPERERYPRFHSFPFLEVPRRESSSGWGIKVS